MIQKVLGIKGIGRLDHAGVLTAVTYGLPMHSVLFTQTCLITLRHP